MDLIAEIGWNHMGDMVLAERMIKAAKEAGATHAKFQTWREKNLCKGPWDEDGRREIYKKAELSELQFQTLSDICRQNHIKFQTSVFNAEDVDAMARVSTESVKIPSPEIANAELLKNAGNAFDTVYLSTGASTEEEIDLALRSLRASGAEIVLLHCVSTYPCIDGRVNLPRINHLREKHHRIGFSDHTPDILSALFAISMGVTAIEKHFTIDNGLPGRDNKFALLPSAFRELSEAAKRYSSMNIDHGVRYQDVELETRTIYRGRWGGVDRD
jgi:sialic acid synthase SpsE